MLAVQMKIIYYLFIYYYYYYYFHTIIKYIKGTVRLRPQIAKANRGGRSYTQSVVNKPVIITLQQYNNIRLNTTMLN